MGQKENSLIGYYSDNRRFAQLANGWLFEGRDYLKPEDLADADRRQEHKSGRKFHRSRCRDILKETRTLRLRLLIGTELQEKVDYAMPLRVMDMDLLSYLHQKRTISAAHQNEDYTSAAEFLSKFTKEDRLIPVVTLVLYLGEEPWDGPENLHELLDLKEIPKEVQQHIENYRIHVLDVRHMPDAELKKFPSDIRFMLMFLKYAKDKEALAHLTQLCGQETVSEDTFEALADYVGEPELMEWRQKQEETNQKEGGGTNMCEGIRALVADGRAEGKEEGRAEAMAQVNALIKALVEQNRIEDLMKSAQDEAYQQKLFEELHI